MALKKWNELPVELRRCPSKRWNYLVEEVGGSSSGSETASEDEDDSS